MTNTAMGVASNLLHMLDSFGFVPNGGRVYYSLPGRSQPPMLSHMVKELYDATQNITFLARAYPSLTHEYAWWMQSGEYGHAVTIAGASSEQPTSYVLNRYVTDQHLPRPESWLEDVNTAEEAGFSQNSPGAQILYSEIAAAAETGWDFSARWFADGLTLTSCDTVRSFSMIFTQGIHFRFITYLSIAVARRPCRIELNSIWSGK
jgi:alpha,alpha-trehalase